MRLMMVIALLALFTVEGVSVVPFEVAKPSSAAISTVRDQAAELWKRWRAHRHRHRRHGSARER